MSALPRRAAPTLRRLRLVAGGAAAPALPGAWPFGLRWVLTVMLLGASTLGSAVWFTLR